MSQRVLLIEDIESLQLIYSTVLKREGFSVDVAATAAEGAAAFAGRPPGIVLLDLLLPDGDGLELLAQMTGALAPGGGPGGGLRVIVITAHGSVNRAVRAMRAGAFDFLVKPFDDGRLVAAVKNARADLQAAQVSPRAQRVGSLGFEGLMGSSPPMRDLYDKITQISRSVAPVMLSGAVGTGKRLAAEAIHTLSNRSGGAFVALDCAAEGAAPLEHRLFGTGGPRANDSPHGALDQADGGTLYLSDVTALDGANQARLLRFLQSSLPPGDLSPEPDRKRDVRLICSAQDDAAAAAALREDLFFRLNVVPLLLPPLAARGDDVIEIA
ncbi:MAG: sigma 54-interacting transcriptional regulator, partial [Pseudomonadota bacterium]